ncbi:MAG: tryptophan-rich sensory protein [Verrucomicrobia bacterium]|nr:tryptophan-rich sensory protein [Verrucomicrobiota bacterium]
MRWISLIGFTLLVLFIEFLGHKMTFVSVGDWYLTLNKPEWTPPSWLFGPVWTILYLAIAISGWLIWVKIKPSAIRRRAFYIYGAQLVANLLWSYFFFFLKSPLLGLIDIIVLVVLITINTVLFGKLYKPAGILLIPYLIWTLYALSLNLAIWELNR